MLESISYHFIFPFPYYLIFYKLLALSYLLIHEASEIITLSKLIALPANLVLTYFNSSFIYSLSSSSKLWKFTNDNLDLSLQIKNLKYGCDELNLDN